MGRLAAQLKDADQRPQHHPEDCLPAAHQSNDEAAGVVPLHRRVALSAVSLQQWPVTWPVMYSGMYSGQ